MSKLHPVAGQLTVVLDELSSVLYERRPALEALNLTLLSKEHGFLIGPPGTAKSMLCRGYFGRIDGAHYFETVLSKTRPAEAVLGPYDIPKLRDEGSLHRKVNGFLPTANFAMLDEVGKMSPTLGHDLLAVVLERRLHQVNGGRSWIDVPLYTFIGGSNEIPTNESEDAAALWDRILVRVPVDYIQEGGHFARLLVEDIDTSGTTIDFKELQDAIDNVVPSIKVTQDTVEAVMTLKEQLLQAEIVASDRRWRQCMKLLKAQAFMQGREQTDVDDLQVLRHALWDLPTQIKTVERLTIGISNPIAESALRLSDDVEEIAQGLRNLKGQSRTTIAEYCVEATAKLKRISVDLNAKKQECISSGKSVGKLEEVSDRIYAVKRMLYTDGLGMEEI